MGVGENVKCSLDKNPVMQQCPIAERVAENASKKVLGDFFKTCGLDINKVEDQKKIRDGVDFVLTMKDNTSRVQIAALTTATGLMVVGIAKLIISFFTMPQSGS